MSTTLYTQDLEIGGPARTRPRLAAVGLWLRRHQRLIRIVQWFIVAIYATLLIVPTLLPLPPLTAHIWNNLTVFAEFVFWGIWWPGVLLSIVLFGRLWCGTMCPEGALSELASRHGRKRSVPRWIRWSGWPFVAFACTTLYGQMISVYQYPLPALLILGGSTAAAIGIGYMYGNDKRVWCRYLCPVSGVFGLLTKLAPFHYAVDRKAWDASTPGSPARKPFNCAPLVPVRTMESSSGCHMCARCAGFRDAVQLEARSPNSEIVEVSSRTATHWDSLLVIFGMLGIATGAFQWSSSPYFVTIKQALATWFVEHGMLWPLQTSMPWWVLTNYPAQSDVMTVLDGAVFLIYVFGLAIAISAVIGTCLTLGVRVTGRWSAKSFYHLSHALIPLAACGLILGLFSTTVTIITADGFSLSWLSEIRALSIAGTFLWSGWLAARIFHARSGSAARTALATALFAVAMAAPVTAWSFLFWIW